VNEPTYTVEEFRNEARYIDRLVWEAIGIERGSSVLLCGYGPDGSAVRRAIEANGAVTVIEHRNEAINRFSKLDAKLLRGSTSVIPARERSFDLAIAFHYLHEVDPFFRARRERASTCCEASGDRRACSSGRSARKAHRVSLLAGKARTRPVRIVSAARVLEKTVAGGRG
jgi:hypothetical protein